MKNRALPNQMQVASLHAYYQRPTQKIEENPQQSGYN